MYLFLLAFVNFLRINLPCLTLSGLAGLRGCSDVVSFCACWCWCWWSSEAVTVAAPFIVPPRSFVIRPISNALKSIHVFFIHDILPFQCKILIKCKNLIIIFCNLSNLLQSFLKRYIIYLAYYNWEIYFKYNNKQLPLRNCIFYNIIWSQENLFQ